MLATVNASALGLTRLDKQASAESDRAHNAMQGTGKTSVNRLPGAEAMVKEIKKCHGLARRIVAARTSQWGQDRRLLPNVHIGPLMGEFDPVKRDHDRMVTTFVANATYYINRAQQNLGTYQVSPPTESEIRGSFSLTLDLTPIPDVSSYSPGMGLSPELERQLKQRFDDDYRAQHHESQRDLLQRLAEPLENLVDRMAAYDEREDLQDKGIDTGRTGTFKSTIVTNITAIADIFDAFNFLNDPVLAEISKRLNDFRNIEHSDLTNSQKLRADTAKKAKAVRDMLGALL